MRILILSLYYSPLNNIASTRVSFFSNYFTEQGHDVHVITRHYSKSNLENNNLDIGMSETDDLDGPYIVKDNTIYTAFKSENTITTKGQKLIKGVKGYYYQKKLDAFHYNYVENGFEAFKKELSHLNFDFILASSPPLAPTILAQQISEQYNIKWISDFRDSPILDEYSFMIRTVRIRAMRKLLASASGLLFVSPGMEKQNRKYLGEVIEKTPSTIIFNGFVSKDEILDEKVLTYFNEIKLNHQIVLTYTGSVYNERNLNTFLSAISTIDSKDIGVVLVGIQKSYQEEYAQKYPHLKLFFIPKTNYSTSLEIQKRSTALLLTIWPGSYTGFSGKVFEYINSSRPIILDHEPAEDLKEYLAEISGVYYCDNDSSKFFKIISELSDEAINRSEKIITKTSRVSQAQKLIQFLNQL